MCAPFVTAVVSQDASNGAVVTSAPSSVGCGLDERRGRAFSGTTSATGSAGDATGARFAFARGFGVAVATATGGGGSSVIVAVSGAGSASGVLCTGQRVKPRCTSSDNASAMASPRPDHAPRAPESVRGIRTSAREALS